MSKNLVYISALDGFADDFPLGIETWKRYCSRMGLELRVETEADPYVTKLYPRMNGSWYPWFSEWLIDNSDTWEKILIVDADTMIRWNAPNIFDIATSSFNVVKDSSPLNYGAIPHLNQWRSSYDVTMPPENYFNAGMIVADVEAYYKIRNSIDAFFDVAQKINASSWEQTPVNMIAWEYYGESINYLPRIWNDMLGFNYREEDLSYINKSFVWHFTGSGFQVDKAKRKRMMEAAYSIVSEKYEH